jgi:regulator of RNase E activity RraA
VRALRNLTGLSSAFSDELDRLGIRTAVPASAAPPLRREDVVIGRAVTIRYLPTRAIEAGNGRLAHLTLFETIGPGDVAVIAAPAGIEASVLGGRAAAAGVRAGLGGLIAFGAVRDVDEILDTGLPVWAARLTPVTGRGRIEAVEINGPLDVAGVQVVPGDVVVADSSGITFVPATMFAEISARIVAG